MYFDLKVAEKRLSEDDKRVSFDDFFKELETDV